MSLRLRWLRWRYNRWPAHWKRLLPATSDRAVADRNNDPDSRALRPVGDPETTHP